MSECFYTVVEVRDRIASNTLVLQSATHQECGMPAIGPLAQLRIPDCFDGFSPQGMGKVRGLPEWWGVRVGGGGDLNIVMGPWGEGCTDWWKGIVLGVLGGLLGGVGGWGKARGNVC
jgi:hypothetical protein